MSFGSFERNRGASSTLSEINMVPLIDVMLVLLVIFIITAPLLSHSIKINLPQASTQPIEQDPVVVYVAIDAQGNMFWNESAVAPESLFDRFAAQASQDPQPELRIRADLNTRYETLANIMSNAKNAGIRRIGFITKPGPKASNSN